MLSSAPLLGSFPVIILVAPLFFSQLPAGSGRNDIRSRYRDMAKALHPDKCRAPGAKDAFQRLFEAYTNLRGFVG